MITPSLESEGVICFRKREPGIVLLRQLSRIPKHQQPRGQFELHAKYHTREETAET